MTGVAPKAKVLPEAGVQVGVIVPLTLSVAVALKVTVAPLGPVASVVILAGRLKVGGVVSRTVTVKLPFAVFPALSFAEQLTVVAPMAKVLPEAGVQVGVIGPSTSSIAEAV